MSDRSLQRFARLAGVMYITVMAAFIAPYAMLQILTVPGDFAATAENVAVSETLYRAALSIQMTGCVGIILLSGALYALLKHEDANLALFAFVWRVGEAILLAIAAVIRFAALRNYTAAHGGERAIGREAVHELIASTVGASTYVAFIFLGLGSLVFFYLFFKSRFIPRALAAFGIVASLIMLVLAFAYLLAPAQASNVGMIGMAPMFVAEVAVGLWLLIGGLRLERFRAVPALEARK